MRMMTSGFVAELTYLVHRLAIEDQYFLTEWGMKLQKH
jgi:hypothetical protein